MKLPGHYILMLEDDADDRYITKTFFLANNYEIGLEFLVNSDHVMPYLEKCLGGETPLPSFIGLEKNLPAGGGMEVLKDIKSHSLFKMIPVVMLSGTAFEGEVNESYRLGVN